MKANIGIIFLFGLLSAFSVDVYAQTDEQNEEYTNELELMKKYDKRGPQLFAIKTPGETFNELTGEIGHSTVDMEMSGNGLLSFKLRRDFERKPAQYPYDLATMSIRIPNIQFALAGGELPAFATCDSMTTNSSRLFNGINFQHEDGNVNLIDETRVQPAVRGLFPDIAIPDDDAYDAQNPDHLKNDFLSHDNWRMDCVGEEYRIRSPNGVNYYFNAQGAESYRQKRATYNNSPQNGDGSRSVYYFMNYKIYVDRIERLNSQLKFVYTQAPQNNDPGNPYSDVQDYRVRPPMHFQAWNGSANIYTGLLLNKRRLTRVELRVSHETSPDPALTENQFMYFTYRGAYQQCPGLLERVHSTSTKVSQVKYNYEPVSDNELSIDAPQTRCVLKEVLHNIESQPQLDPDGDYNFRRAWTYEYGAVGSESSYYFPISAVRSSWPDYYHRTGFLPLHAVTTPTGATTRYTYRTGRVCDYQDTHNGRYRSVDIYCDDDADGQKIPWVTKRTVSGEGLSDQVTQILYNRRDDDYTVDRVIFDEESWHLMVFGRLDRDNIPTEALTDRQIKSGKLLSYQLYDSTNLNKPPLVTTTNTYAEALRFPLSAGHTPTSSWSRTSGVYASWHDNRLAYLLDSRRVNLVSTVTQVDGVEYETKYNQFDFFNNPTEIQEFHRVGGVENSRTITMSYDNNYSGKQVYFVSALKYREINAGEDFPLIDRYTYNPLGLLGSKTIAGFTTSYAYHRNGDVHMVIDGRNQPERRTAYSRGIPKLVVNRDLSQVERKVDSVGNVTEETDENGVKVYYTYSDRYKRLSKRRIDPSESDYLATNIQNPQFATSDDSNYRMKTEIVYGKYRKDTNYDVLGRVVSIDESDLTGPIEKRIQRFTYDKLGRMTFKGFVREDNTATYGTHYEYDNFGRIENIRYPLANSPAIQYCHGPTCAGNFATIGAVKDGYAMRDQDGYVTVHNYRSFGHPGNKELVEIRQEIRPGSWNDSTDSAVITEIFRNKVGFINEVRQKGSDNSSPAFSRIYEPYSRAGSTTYLVESENHPEFGTKRVDQYDANGNVIKATNFNNAQTTYVYDPMDRLRYAQNPGAAGETVGVPTTEYRYYPNGDLQNVIHGDRVWTYDYNYVNLLESEQLTIDGRTFRIEYGYDTFAKVDSIVYPASDGSFEREFDYTINGFGLAKSIEGVASNITYHPTGTVENIDFANGTRFSSTEDSYQRPDVWRTEGEDANALFHFKYLYDNRSNIVGINNYFPPNGGSLINMSYDGLNRLTRADAPGVWEIGRFSYDPIGNIEKKHVGGNNMNYFYSTASNQMTVVSSNELTSNYGIINYDSNGNMIQHGLADYKFDQLNRLAESDDGASVLNNIYDGHNMRVKGVTNRDGNISTTYYIYNLAGQLMHEFDVESGEARDNVQLNGRTIATFGSHNFHDTDNDGMPDYFERLHGLDIRVNDANGDSDMDGLTNLEEYQYGLLPTNSDTDGDGISDGDEIERPPESPTGVDITPIIDLLMD